VSYVFVTQNNAHQTVGVAASGTASMATTPSSKLKRKLDEAEVRIPTKKKRSELVRKFSHANLLPRVNRFLII